MGDGRKGHPLPAGMLRPAGDVSGELEPRPLSELQPLPNDDLIGERHYVVDREVAGDGDDEVIVQEDHLIRLPKGHAHADIRRGPVGQRRGVAAVDGRPLGCRGVGPRRGHQNAVATSRIPHAREHLVGDGLRGRLDER